MGMLVWVMMALALWHFTVFLPEHFWGGIAGAFLGAIAGALIFGVIVSGFAVPGRNDTDLVTALIAIPGAAIGMGVVYVVGLRNEREEAAASLPAG